MKLLENYKKGISVNGIDLRTGKFKRLKKWHYFKDGISLCKKYKQIEKDNLLPLNTIFKNELCSKCKEVLANLNL